MNILYLEHYPHYSGNTTNSTAEISEENLMVLSLFAEDKEDLLSDLEIDEVEEEALDAGEIGCAFFDLIKGGGYGEDKHLHAAKYWKRVWRALKTKGYWVDEWEEGSHGLALPEMKEEAVNAIARQEARISQDSFDW